MTEKSIIVADWNLQSVASAPVPYTDLREYLAALQTKVDILTLQDVTNAISPQAGQSFDLKRTIEQSMVVKDQFYTPFWEAEELHDNGKAALYFHGDIQDGNLILVINPDYETVVKDAVFYDGKYDASKDPQPKIIEKASQPRAVQRMVVGLNDGDKRLQLVNTLGPSAPSLENTRKQLHAVLEEIDPKIPTVVTGDFCCKSRLPGPRDLIHRRYLRSPVEDLRRAAENLTEPRPKIPPTSNDIMFGRDWIVPLAFAVLGPQLKVYDFGSKRKSRLLDEDLDNLPNCPTANPPVLFEFAISWLQIS